MAQHYVLPKAYDRWKPSMKPGPSPTMKKKTDPEKKPTKPPVKRTTPPKETTPIKEPTPVKETTPPPEGGRARPHPGKAGEIEGPPKGKGLVPIKDIPPGPQVPTGPSRPQGGRQFEPIAGAPDRPALEAPRVGARTVADMEASQRELGETVKAIMAARESKYSDRRGWREGANLDTGSIHTGVVVEQPALGRGAAPVPSLERGPVPALPEGGRAPLALPTRQTASTERIQRIQMDDTVPIPRDVTRELPRVGTQFDQTIDFQAIAPARTPFAMRSPLPVGGGRTPEQLALFHAPGEPVNPTLSTRQHAPIALSGGSNRPGQRVTKLSARTVPGKQPGDQGTLFQPARYRSVT